MANRSYLYNIDFNRFERNKIEDDKILGVSEYAYEIPIVYKILVSTNSLNTYSILWDYEHPIAISGDAISGKKKMFNFLNELKLKSLYENEFIDEQIKKTTSFFNDNSFELKYFFLELGELYEMGNEPFEEQNELIFNEVQSIDKTIATFYESISKLNIDIQDLIGQKEKMTKKSWFRKSKYVLNENERNQIDKKINNLEMTKNALLGIDNWSTVLYFHYGE